MTGLIQSQRQVITRPAFAPPDLAFSNFNDGTLGPIYTDPYSTGDQDFPDDPTSSGRGKVLRIHYQHFTSPDRNQAMAYSGAVRFGQTIYFGGDCYLAIPDWSYPPGCGRKLTYFFPNQNFTKYGGDGGPEFESVLGTNGDSKLWYYIDYTDQNGVVHAETTSTGVDLPASEWFRLENQISMESSPGAGDGIYRVWLNGTLILDRTGLTRSDPNWIRNPRPGGNGTPLDVNDVFIRDFLVGQQLNFDGPFDEYRYWDNVGFSTQRIGP